MFRANGPIKTQNGASSQLWNHCKDCVTVLYNERGKERHGNYINGFSGKKFNLGQFGHFGPKMEHPHNFGSASDFFLILHNARGQEVHEILLVVFEKKSHLGQFDLFRPFFTV